MSTPSTKKLTDLVELLLGEVKDLKKIIKTQNIDINIIKENSNLIQVKVSDLSCKIDYDISTLNITSTKTLKKVVEDKTPKVNIMSYFKIKYKSMPESLESIVSKKEVDELLVIHDANLKKKDKKTDIETTIANLIYKELIKPSDKKMKLLRTMKETEESNNTVVDSEIIENNINNDAQDNDHEEDDD